MVLLITYFIKQRKKKEESKRKTNKSFESYPKS